MDNWNFSKVVTSDKLHDFLMNPKSRPDLQTPEAQAFLNHLGNHFHNEKTDALMPWLTREWKKGRLQYETPNPNDPFSRTDIPALKWNYGPPVDGPVRFHPEMLNHWADFYNSNHPERRALGDIMQKTLPDFHQHVQNWDQAMEEEAHDKALAGGQIVHQYPDNWSLRQLTTPEELKAEGDACGHCVGGYHQAVANGDSLIYSLRDHEGKPHATLEIEPNWLAGTNPAFIEGTNRPTSIPPEQIQPHRGNVIQIQGKANQEPLPEYKERLKQWFDTFHPDEKPQWDPSSQDTDYVLWDPSDIQREDLNPHLHDEYGLARPQRDVDWPAMMENMINRNGRGAPTHDYSDAQNAYELAKARGEIPQYAAALGNWEQNEAQPAIQDHIDNNYEYMPEYNEEDPEFNQDKYDRQYDEAQNELLRDTPYHQALQNLYAPLQQHWDESTKSYQNVPSQQSTFSSWDFRESMAVDLYHTAPTSARESILKHGLVGQNLAIVKPVWDRNKLGQPYGNYFHDDPAVAEQYAYGLHRNLYKSYEVPGDDEDQFIDHGVYNGTIMEPGPENEDGFIERPYNHFDPNHRALLPPHLQGYDIWRVPEGAIQGVQRDPENLLAYERQEDRPFESPQTFEQAKGITQQFDEPDYHGSSPSRYYVPGEVPPEALQLYHHLPAWDMTEINHDALMEHNMDKELPEPYHHVPIENWETYKPPSYDEAWPALSSWDLSSVA